MGTKKRYRIKQKQRKRRRQRLQGLREKNQDINESFFDGRYIGLRHGK